MNKHWLIISKDHIFSSRGKGCGCKGSLGIRPIVSEKPKFNLDKRAL
jgi:hypothetical protein